jgi:hypothetical protein
MLTWELELAVKMIDIINEAEEDPDVILETIRN